MANQMKEEADRKRREEDDEVDISQIKRAKTSVDDITSAMNKLTTKKKKKGDTLMEVTKVIKKPEPGSRIAELKKKSKNKRNRSQLKF